MESSDPIFPPELWQKILKFVPPRDLLDVVLASQHMNSVGSMPDLWATMKVNMGKLRDNGLAQLYNIHRFKGIKTMDFKDVDFKDVDFTTEVLNQLFKDIPESPLENMTINWRQLREVPEAALGKAVKHVQSFTVKRGTGEITTEDFVKLGNVLQSAKAVFNLDLSVAWLVPIPGDLLAKVISQLTSVYMNYAKLTNDQWRQVLEASLNSTTLVDVSLHGLNLSGVQANLLASAVKRLHKVSMHCTHLTTEKATEVLKAIYSSTTLIDVNMAGVNLSGVKAYLLAGAVKRLHKVDMRCTRLTTELSTEVVKAINSSTSLIYVCMSGVDLSGVQAYLLASAVKRLHKVYMQCTDLTTEQSTEVVKAIVSSTTLEYVWLYGNNISAKVAAGLLNTLPRNVAHYN